MTKARDTSNLVSSVTGIAVTLSGDPLILGVGNTEHVRVTGGNVGIGSTQPTAKLSVGAGFNTTSSSGYGIGNKITEVANNNTGCIQLQASGFNNAYFPVLEIYNGSTRTAYFKADGNLVLQNGSGIDFSGTGDGGETMTSELLDDYEEGSWTPVALSPGSNGFVDTSTFSNVKCFYTKIGRLVNLYGSFDIASNSGNIAQGDYLDLDNSCLPYNITQADITTLGDVWWYANLGGNINASGQCITVSGSYLRFFVQTVVGTVSRNTAPMSFSLSYITTQ